MRNERSNNRRRIRFEQLEARQLLTADLHVVPFSINGTGDAPLGLPLVPDESAEHFATGEATRLGSYDGMGEIRFLGFTSENTGTFKSERPFVFEGFNQINGGGDIAAFAYGDMDAGADSVGTFTIFPAGFNSDGAPLITVEFVAEFTLDTETSTGRFDKYTEGSFTMIATTEPFVAPAPGELVTNAFDYSWRGEGTLSYPVGKTFEVTNHSDDVAEIGSLPWAVSEANINEGIDTITFSDGLGGRIGLSEELQINEDLTIIGPGQQLAVSGQGQTRVMAMALTPLDTDRVDLEIHDLTIADGLAVDAPGIPVPGFAFGGGVYNPGGDLVLENVLMKNNQAGDGSVPLAAGGAIGNEFGGTVSVNDSRFVDNSAVGIVIGTGGAITSDVGPTLDGLGSKSPVTLVSNSTFSRNTATALVTDPANAPGFEPFAGFAFGGAINALAGELIVDGSTFARNEVFSGDGVDGNSSGNANGGAIFVSDFSPFIAAGTPGRDSSNILRDSRFVRNAAYAGDGSGAAVGGQANGGAVVANISFFPNTLTVEDSSFRQNRAVGGNGGSDDGAGGQGSGGGLATMAGASVEILGSSFRLNSATGGSGQGEGAGGVALGGAVAAKLTQTSVPTPFEQFPPVLVMADTSVSLNAATAGRGGRSGGDGGIGKGGGIGVDGAAAAFVSGATIFGNLAQGGRAGPGGSGGDAFGGGIYNDNSEFTLTTTRTVFNASSGAWSWSRRARGTGFGGGIYNGSGGTFMIDADSVDATFANWASDFASRNFFGDFDEI